MDEKLHVYECKYCGERFIEEDWEGFGKLEQALWDHIYWDHMDLCKKFEDLNTPEMIEKAYEHKELEDRT